MQFPQSAITAIELAPQMVLYAQNSLAEKASGGWQVVSGSVMQMPFPEASFDFAVARLVFQHLPDPSL